jgi:RNA polymerase sigma factor (sigma-70 family)
MQKAPLARTLNAVIADFDCTSDGELLRRFVATKDDSAFELLLRRHADVVLTVCRSILHQDWHAAEDAFQATFIALARNANALTKGGALGAWLFRVARHAALRIRKRKSKFASEALPNEISTASPSPDRTCEASERGAVVAEEIERLPARYREPVILCFYCGLTHSQASLELGWSVGTIASRIARAKERLRKRLTRRGVVLGSSMAGTIGISETLTAHTSFVRSCVVQATGHGLVPDRLHSLANEVISIMRRTQRKWLLAAPILAIGLTLGVVFSGTEANESPIPKLSETPKLELSNSLMERNNAVRAERLSIAGAKERAYIQQKLTQLAQAIWSYQLDHGHLPTDIVDKEGKALLSWRVAILPYIEQRALYKHFKLDEPWDSPANKPWSEIIIKLYTSAGPFDPKRAGYTFIKRYTGPNTLHRPGEKVDFSKMTDGRGRQTVHTKESS